MSIKIEPFVDTIGPTFSTIIQQLRAKVTRRDTPDLIQAAHQVLIKQVIHAYRPGDINSRVPGVWFRAVDGVIYALVGDPVDLEWRNVATYEIESCPKGLL